MWLIFALASALFSGATAVLSKYGAEKVNPNLAVALRSVVMLGFAWCVLLLFGGWKDIARADAKALLFPLLSGITNSLAWICYFRALRKGRVSEVAAIDKAGIALTMIGGWILLGESMTLQKAFSMGLILIGALVMTEKRSSESESAGQTGVVYSGSHSEPAKHSGWLIWAILSAMLASATTLLSKAGSARLSSDFGFAIRTGVMFIISWAMIFARRNVGEIRQIDRKSICIPLLSGLGTALAWFCYFKALASPAAEAGIVQPIDKLSIVVSVIGARIFLKEKIRPRMPVGLSILTVGILVLLL